MEESRGGQHDGGGESEQENDNLTLEEELHSESAWECHDDALPDRDDKLAEAPHTPALQEVEGSRSEVPRGGGPEAGILGAWPVSPGR